MSRPVSLVPPEVERVSEDELFIRMSVDFGTYASGCGWCVRLAREDDPGARRIFTFDQWPGQPTASVKTRTALLLDRDGGVVAWGYEAARLWALHRHDRRDRGWRYKQHFKMSLAREDLDGKPYKSIALDRDQDDAEELIAKFLRCMREHMLRQIEASGYCADDVLYCLTVPSVWTDRQKAVMRRCALNAGFPTEDGRLLLALEPEAAAQHARISGVQIAGSGEADRKMLNTPESRFVVADCGGGTTDLTSYVVESSGYMIEAGTVSGEMCGGAFVNAAFEEQVLIPRLGGPKQFVKLQDTCPEGIEELLDSWERAKLNVAVGQDAPFYLPIVASLARKIPARVKRALAQTQEGIDDSIVVTPDEIATTFESVIPQICTLVDEQLYELRKEPTGNDLPVAVLLAGGFAASSYLRQRLIEHLGADAVVVVSPNPQVAILSGAVHFACQPDIRARRARRTYGIAMSMRFRDGIDPEAKRETLEKENDKDIAVCLDRFKPMIEKGDLVLTGQEVSAYGTPLTGKQTEVTINFYSASDDTPDYVDQPGCEFLGEVEVDLTRVMRLDLDRRGVRVFMKFGETEIQCRAVLVETGEELDHTLDLLAS